MMKQPTLTQPTLAQAGPIMTLLMHSQGFHGIYTPGNRILYIKNKLTPSLLAHEYTHYTQCKRDGYYTFWSRIVWYYFISPGYNKSPYEIEARKAEADITKQKKWDTSAFVPIKPAN